MSQKQEFNCLNVYFLRFPPLKVKEAYALHPRGKRQLILHQKCVRATLRLMADFGEKVRRQKQAVICKLLVKSSTLHCPLAFHSRFTKPGREP